MSISNHTKQSSGKQNSNIQWLSAILLFTVPFIVYAPFMIEKVLMPRLIWLGLIQVGLSIYFYKKYATEFTKAITHSLLSPISLSLFLLFLIITAGAYKSLHIPSALIVSGKLFCMLYFFSLTHTVLSKEYVSSKQFLSCICAGILISIFLGVGQLAIGISSNSHWLEMGTLYAVNSVFAHKNIFSVVLFLSIPFIYLFGKVTNKLIISHAIIVLVILFLVFLQTRAVLLSGVIAIVVTFIFAIAFYRKKVVSKLFEQKKWLAFLLLISIFISSFVWLMSRDYPVETMNFTERILAITNTGEEENIYNYTVQERLFLWKQTWELIKEKPLSGYGSGNWRFLFPQVGVTGTRAAQGDTIFQRAHNDWLQLWFENGITGVFLYFIFLILSFYFIVKANLNKHYIVLFAVFVFTAWICISFFDFPNERIIPIFLLLSFIAFATKGHEFYPIKQSGKVSNSVFFFCFLLNALILLGNTSYAIGEVYTKKAYQVRNTEKTAELHYYVDKAMQFGYSVDYTATPLNYYKGEAYFAEQKLHDALISFKNAEKINPYHLMTLHNTGLVYHLLGEAEEAEKYWSKALNISNHFEQSLIVLSFLNYQKQNIKAAMCYLSQIPHSSLHPNYDAIINTVMKNYIHSFAEQVEEENIKNKIYKIAESIEWKKKILSDMQTHERNAGEQLTLDAMYYLNNINEKDSIKLFETLKNNNEFYYYCNF